MPLGTERLLQLYLQPACRLCGWVWLSLFPQKAHHLHTELRPDLQNGSQSAHLARSWDLCFLSQILREAARVSSVGRVPGRLWKLRASAEACFRHRFQRCRLSKAKALKFSWRCPRTEITALSLLFPLGSGCHLGPICTQPQVCRYLLDSWVTSHFISACGDDALAARSNSCSQLSLAISPSYFASFMASPETLGCFTNSFHSSLRAARATIQCPA